MKSTQRIQSIGTGKLMLGVLAAAFAFTAVAHAQPAFSGKFVLPQEVRWNHAVLPAGEYSISAVLPAGEYSISMSSLKSPAMLYSTRTGETFYTAPPMISDNIRGGTELHISVRQGERIVNSLNLPGMRKSLIFAPQTKAEEESAARAGHSEVTPVVTAQK